MKEYFKPWLTILIVASTTVVVMLLVVQPARAAGPLYVAPGGTDSANDCTNSASPCATVQYAVGVATSGDEIQVAVGTYTGTGDEVVLIDKNITLSGGWNGSFTTQSGTSTIDGEMERRGIVVNSGTTAVIEYFTVQNGSTTGHCGGIWNWGGTVTLNNSTVSSNITNAWGGGIYNLEGTMILNDSTVSGNSGSEGGGINNYNGTLTINNSTISDNSAGYDGGGIYLQGLSTQLFLFLFLPIRAT